jgi:hypothetical protein
MLNFRLSPELLLNKTANPDNRIYNTNYDGTINLSTVNAAQSLGTKGHYMDSDPLLQPLLPIIRDHMGNVMQPDRKLDETTLGIERYSGVCV